MTAAVLGSTTRDTPSPATKAALRVALVGNPNSGKSTLFNALTGLRQHVANYPGVTVERMEGGYTWQGTPPVVVIDLPGTYTLAGESPDEAIAISVLNGAVPGVPPVDVIVVVVDAENLERNLYLATQVLELRRPTVIALNRADRLAAAGISVDVPALIHELGAVVVPVVATRHEGIDRLRHVIARAQSLPLPTRGPNGQHSWTGGADGSVESDAACRYRWIRSALDRTVTRSTRTAHMGSDRVDAIVLHRLWGPLIFLALMALVFQVMFTIAAPLGEAMQALVNVTGSALLAALPPGELRSLLVDGALNGVGSVVVFLPQIAVLFLCIGLLEDSGYMARAAFVMDRFMRPLGLQGKSFIPLISGYACAVPAIMATRTIQQPNERAATIMVLPLMSCSARLPVYTLLIGAFVPAVTVAGLVSLQGLTLLGMYLLGTVAALAVAAIFRRTLLSSPTRALIIELPSYSRPSVRVLLASVWQRVQLFLRRAGTIIFALSVLLWALASYPGPAVEATLSQEARLEQTMLGRLGHAVEPVVRPLGYDWKIGVSIVSSFAAREVFVSTMATIYGVSTNEDTSEPLAARLRAERDPGTGQRVYTPLVAIGLMCFYVFALMCTSTIAVTIREMGGGLRGARWAALQFGYMLALAYGAGFVVYQAGLALGFGGAS